MIFTSIVRVPFNGQVIEAQKDSGTISVALKPLCENLGIEYTSQYRRLQRQPWAVVAITATTGADGKIYDMAMIDRRTFTMWLATIDTSRLRKQTAKDMVVAYQREAADALDRYFNTGVAVNEHLLKAQHLQRLENMELIKAAEGIVHKEFLEAKARIVIGRELGEVPELDPSTRPLYVSDYLKEKNIPVRQRPRISPNFGKQLKKLYVSKHGQDPARADTVTSYGQIRKVYAYTEADRPLFDQTWVTQFAPQQQLTA
ncbi:antirepressor [Bifidobacterium aquikefiri]|uniref:Antirepressor n=1 Tax=Bifidobacterium aquikefiri TaxID=1653207 RepID=A0A261G2B4_9BIFI|nr:phage antirepressor N-terminal domain-containing protein [Bifidobacterium aquikefiri]OZG65518.1 antirepressor [Bifidobacterium aquikefiri]